MEKFKFVGAFELAVEKLLLVRDYIESGRYFMMQRRVRCGSCHNVPERAKRPLLLKEDKSTFVVQTFTCFFFLLQQRGQKAVND